ncbi:MAG: insulinase family protein [Chthoniobacterales bacterium]|nr:insulinase family protein [Chthoniobacterales bacterium]
MSSSLHKPQLFTLSNGLTLIVEEDHTLPVAAVNACCGTGLLHEGKYLGSGISHMLEHMFFKGTARRAQEALCKR